MVHRLVGRQPGDRGHDPEGVGRKEDDVFRVPARATRLEIGDVVDRVAGAGVLGDPVGVEVHGARGRVEHHVLEHGAEPLGGAVDLRLGLLPKPDHLGVAATFEVEHSAVAPAMLVVADEAAGRIGGERRLAGAGEPEEHRRIAVGADVGGAVHGHDALGRQHVVERAEDRFLHLTGVAGPADQHQLPAQVDHDEGAAPGAVPVGVRLEVGGVEHREAWTELCQLGRHRPDEHVADKQGVPRVRGNEPDGHPVGRIGAPEEVLHVQLAGVEIGAHVLVQPLERLGIEPRVPGPPDPVGGPGLLDDELVLGRAAGVGRGDGDECAVVGELSFAAAERVFDESGRRQIGMNPDGKEAVLDEGEALARDCARLGTHTLLGAGARRKARPASVPTGDRNYKTMRREAVRGERWEPLTSYRPVACKFACTW